MTVETPATPSIAPVDPGTVPPEGAAEPETFSREYVENLRRENASYRTKAKDANEATKAADNARLAAMSDADRAVAEAETRGRSAATQAYGQRLARAEFATEAAKRNPDVDTTRVLEFADLTRFVGEDGEPDTKAIKTAVELLVPVATTGPPSFDGGTRTPAPVGADMNATIRRSLGRG